MAFTPRKEEYALIVEMLESDEFNDAPSMAKAIVKEVSRMLWHRDWYATAITWPDADGNRKAKWMYGPFTSESDVQKFGNAHLLVGGGASYVWDKMYSPARTIGHAEGAPGVKGFCKTCGHSPFAHGVDGSSRGECKLTDCPCKKWVEIK